MSSNRTAASVLASALALAVGACASHAPAGAEAAKAPLLRPTEQFKVKVEQTPEQLALGPHTEGLSAAQTTALGRFVETWRAAGGGEIVIQAPTTGDQTAVANSTSGTQAELTALGVPPGVVRVEGYEATAGEVRPPVRVSFARYDAKGDDCSQGWDNLVKTGQNEPSKHFGCAVTSNFAAQLANPRDALEPTPTDASDATRRSVVMGLYRKGEVTSSKADAQSSGVVSKVVP